MKFGGNTYPHRDLMQELEQLAAMNPDLIEFDLEPPGAPPDYVIRQAGTIKKFLDERGLAATGHAPFWVELGSPDLVVRATWIAEVKKMVDACSKIGARTLVIHGNISGLGFISEVTKKKSMQILAESFSFLRQYGEKRNVIVTLENTWESPDEFAYILKHAPDLKVTIDIGHAYMQGGMHGIEIFLKRFAGRIAHIQVSDNGGHSDDHEELGKGKVPLRAVGKLLKSIGYDGTVALEVFKDKPAVKRSLKFIRKIWV
jgi:sugar phosphate isomerase/epimerase